MNQTNQMTEDCCYARLEKHQNNKTMPLHVTLSQFTKQIGTITKMKLQAKLQTKQNDNLHYFTHYF